MREYTVTVTEELDIQVDGMSYNGRDKLFGGYSGENEATRLAITFPSAFDGYSFYLKFLSGGTTYTTSAYTDDVDYDIPSTYINIGDLVFWIEIHNGDQIMKTPKVNFEIKA